MLYRNIIIELNYILHRLIARERESTAKISTRHYFIATCLRDCGLHINHSVVTWLPDPTAPLIHVSIRSRISPISQASTLSPLFLVSRSNRSRGVAMVSKSGDSTLRFRVSFSLYCFAFVSCNSFFDSLIDDDTICQRFSSFDISFHRIEISVMVRDLIRCMLSDWMGEVLVC